MSALLDLIKEHEGVVKHAYQDSRGYWTIGVGRLIDEKLKGGLSDDEIDYLLANDVKRCEDEAVTYPFYAKMDEARKAVIISMLFNLGKPNFDKFQNMQAASTPQAMRCLTRAGQRRLVTAPTISRK